MDPDTARDPDSLWNDSISVVKANVTAPLYTPFIFPQFFSEVVENGSSATAILPVIEGEAIFIFICMFPLPSIPVDVSILRASTTCVTTSFWREKISSSTAAYSRRANVGATEERKSIRLIQSVFIGAPEIINDGSIHVLIFFERK